MSAVKKRVEEALNKCLGIIERDLEYLSDAVEEGALDQWDRKAVCEYTTTLSRTYSAGVWSELDTESGQSEEQYEGYTSQQLIEVLERLKVNLLEEHAQRSLPN